MSDARSSGSPFDDLRSLSDQQLKKLVEAAFTVIEPADLSEVDEFDARTAPPTVLRSEVSTGLKSYVSEDTAAKALDSLQSSVEDRAIAIALLTAMGSQPAMRSEIEAAYMRRSDMMFVDPVSLSILALVVLIIKVKRVRVRKGRLDVDFESLKPEVLRALLEGLGL